MKADRSHSHFLRLSRKSSTLSSGNTRKLEAIRKLFAVTLRRLLGTGERLRATLGDETD
jgi:hypothetical protein